MREAGYQKLALRSVAEECGIAVGTIYNYFPSKDMLVASVIAADWRNALLAMREGCTCAEGLVEGFRDICQGINAFSCSFSSIWAEYAFAGSAKYSFSEHHKIMRGQLAELARLLLRRFEQPEDEGICAFLAEALLTSALQEELGFETFARVIDALFVCKKGYQSYEQLQEPPHR